MWAASALIGGLRTASNERREDHRDRGPTGNAIVDIQGVIGELILFDHLSRHLSKWPIRPLLLDWGGGASAEASSRADLELVLESETVVARKVRGDKSPDRTVTRPTLREPIEAKCHLDLSSDDVAKHGLKNKRDFAVNQKAICGSYAIGARLMVPLVAAPGKPTAYIGRPILISDVLRWPAVDYGYQDIALAMPLIRVSPLVWGADWQTISERLHAASTGPKLDVLTYVHQGALARFSELRDDPDFKLDELEPKEVIELCAAIARNIVRSDKTNEK
jgi:hypothetical protein